jgi:hypothetical protein
MANNNLPLLILVGGAALVAFSFMGDADADEQPLPVVEDPVEEDPVEEDPEDPVDPPPDPIQPPVRSIGAETAPRAIQVTTQ